MASALSPTTALTSASLPNRDASLTNRDPSLLSRDRKGAVLLLLLLCLPSLAFVCTFHDVPHFGVLQDDSLYYAGAKTIAHGSGYKIFSLPAEPYQTKYPPLYPLYLSLAWLANPSFPSNLTIALALSWISLPVILLLLYKLRQPWLILALVAINPYVLFYASNIGSELFFLAILLGAILSSEKDRPLTAGLLGRQPTSRAPRESRCSPPPSCTF